MFWDTHRRDQPFNLCKHKLFWKRRNSVICCFPVDLKPVWNTAKSTKKGPTFRLVSHNERLVGETFPIPISLHISTQTVQDLKSPVTLTVWQ